MRWAIFGVFAIGAVFGAALAVSGGEAQAEEQNKLEEEVQLLSARLATQEKKIGELESALGEHKTEFLRHSHPVKFWNPREEKSTSWNGGVYFIAYPKVGSGPGDAAAAAAGGTWGTP